MTEHERSTGKTHRVDLSPAVDAAFAARAPLSEAQLFAGHGMSAFQDCVCGWVIEADPWCPMPAVAEHNNSPKHLVWRQRREVE